MLHEQRIRAILFYLSVLIFLMGLPPILSSTLGYNFDKRTFKFTKAGLIVLKTQPQGASVYLDKKLLSFKTPATINELLPGKYELKFEMDKYYPWSGEVEVGAGKVTRLEKIIAEFKLYEEERQSMTQEEVIEIMRKDIWVKMGGKEGYFSISYQGKDPKVVAMVTNKLASLYIEENLKFREQQAQGTSEFVTLELNGTREKLEEKEKAITEFKRKYLPELPEQRESNLKVLGQLQLEQQRISDSLKAAQDRKVVVQKQVSELKALAAQSSKAEKGQEEKPLPVSSPFLVSEVPSSPAPKPEKPRFCDTYP